MNGGVLVRTVLLTVAAFVVLAWAPLAARAVPCPAKTSGFEPANPQRTLFGFRIASQDRKDVSGDVAVDTDRGWFSVPVAQLRLSPFPPGGFISGVLYARFLQPVTVRRYWFESDGAACYPPLSVRTEPGGRPFAPAPSTSAVIQAQVREPYGNLNCAEPFAPVRILNIVEPDFPHKNATFPGQVEIVVSVGADGKVQDASIQHPSGTPAFDDAALDAARKSTYTPAVAYCLAQPGEHLYQATLRP